MSSTDPLPSLLLKLLLPLQEYRDGKKHISGVLWGGRGEGRAASAYFAPPPSDAPLSDFRDCSLVQILCYGMRLLFKFDDELMPANYIDL